MIDDLPYTVIMAARRVAILNQALGRIACELGEGRITVSQALALTERAYLYAATWGLSLSFPLEERLN